MAKTVHSKEERTAQFIKTGIKLAKKVGLDKVSASSVATEHKITAPLIFHIFGTREKFHAAIKAEAKKQGVDISGPKKAVPARKRSIAEVRAIKDKTVTSTARSAETGRMVTKAFAKANPKTTVVETAKRKVLPKRKEPRKVLPKPEKPKYPTLPKPALEDAGSGVNLVQKI